MRKLMCIGCLLCLLAACSNDREESGIAVMPKAHIFERRVLPGNKLLVSYTYQKGPKLVNDSSIVDNKIISQDSVPVNLLVKNGDTPPTNP